MSSHFSLSGFNFKSGFPFWLVAVKHCLPQKEAVKCLGLAKLSLPVSPLICRLWKVKSSRSCCSRRLQGSSGTAADNEPRDKVEL